MTRGHDEFSLEDVIGSLPNPPGVDPGDFEALIEEATVAEIRSLTEEFLELSQERPLEGFSMADQKTTLTSKGQITLPASIRRELNLQPQDRFTVRAEGDNRVVLERDELDLEDIIGSLPPLPADASDDLDEIIEEAIEEALFGENGKYREFRR